MSTVSNQRFVPVKLFSTSYTPFGKTSDVPIILIHGLFATYRTWNSVKCKLGDILKRTVFVYDLRNHGKSEFCDENLLEIEIDVADLKHFMDTKKIPKAILIGHSAGSRVAMAFSFQYGNMVDMLVVEDMSLTYCENHMESYKNVASVIKKMGDLFKTIPPTYTEEEAQKKIGKFVSELIPELSEGPSGSKFQLLAPIHKDFKANKFVWDVNMAICSAMETRDQVHYINLENNPVYNGKTLFINGDKSIFSLDHDKELIPKHFPNAYYENFKDGYHAFHQENPKLFLTIVENFINSKG